MHNKRPFHGGGKGLGARKPAPKPAAHVPARERSAPTHWAEVAEWYDALVGDEGSEYHREVILPGVMRMLGLAKMPGEKRVLDLACGQGVLARKLAALAEVSVTAVDAAEPLIAAGRRRNERDGLRIRYVVADATKLLDENGAPVAGMERGGFDAITVILAIQNISPLSPVWQACRALLKPGGKLVIVMMHPSFRIPRKTEWLWEESTGTQPRVVRKYLGSEEIEIETHPGRAAIGKESPTTTHFHRPLQAYVNTLGSAGLLIDHMEEWASHKKSQPGPRQKALDFARQEFPMFMAMRARPGTEH